MSIAVEVPHPDIVRIGIGERHAPFADLKPDYTSKFPYGRLVRKFALQTGEFPEVNFHVFIGVLDELKPSIPESEGRIILYINSFEGELERRQIVREYQDPLVSGGKVIFQAEKRVAPEYEKTISNLQLHGQLGDGYYFEGSPLIHVVGKPVILFRKFVRDSGSNRTHGILSFEPGQLHSIPELELRFDIRDRFPMPNIF